MENNKLISMTEFVKKEYDKIPEIPTQKEAVKFAITVNNYAKFLSQPLTLSVFVPCDDEGNVLEEPAWWFRYCNGASPFMNMDEIRPCQQYSEALQKRLFTGFYIRNTEIDNDSITKVVTNEKEYPFHFTEGEWQIGIGNKIVEDLQKGLKLSETALKQIYV